VVLILLSAVENDSFGQSGYEVGEAISLSRESPHPYTGSNEPAIVWRDTILFTDTVCAYIAVHFASFGLQENDRIIVRNFEDTRRYAYSPALLAGQESFWSPPLPGNALIVEILAEDSLGAYGYVIDSMVRGFTHSELSARYGESSGFVGICGDDNKRHAICLTNLDPLAYNHAKAVGRVWISPTEVRGSGWFWGGDGHFMTSMHNFSEGNGPASASGYKNTTMIEIMAESGSCQEDCADICLGQFVSTGFTEQGYDLFEGLDFTLLKLHMLMPDHEENITYLKVREGGPKLHEAVYIPGHPGQRPKMVSFFSDQQEDIALTETLVDGLGRVHLHAIEHPHYSKVTPSFPADITVSYGLAYFADTEGGMSGSPVISLKDNLVVGMHNKGAISPTFGQCPNGGLNIMGALAMIDPEVLPPGAIGPDCYGPWADITISEDQVISADYFSTGNLVIANGSQLHVQGGSLYMPEDASILIERNARLVVSGNGTIRKCPHSRGKWEGIRIRGNADLPQPGPHPLHALPPLTDPDQSAVMYMDTGYIYDAKVAISTKGLNNDPDDYGGVMYIKKGYFDRNTLPLEFMPYTGVNRSRVHLTMFVNTDLSADHAVWMWGVQGVEFTRTRFHNFNFEGIRGFDSAIRVYDACVFDDAERGISLEYTMPNPFAMKTQIGDLDFAFNLFTNNTHHIVAQGVPRIDIHGNVFYGGTSGVTLAGTSRHILNSNSFSNMDWGALKFFSGYNQNGISSIACNEFLVRKYGSVAIGDNNQTRYWGNVFDLEDTDSRDMMISQLFIPGWAQWPGEIYEFQGDPQFPADNCFTDTVSRVDFFFNGANVKFDYWHRPLEEALCEVKPVEQVDYFNLKKADPGRPAPDCEAFLRGNDVLTNPTLQDLTDLQELLHELSPHIASSIDTLMWYKELWEEKEALLEYFVQLALDSNDVVSAEQVIASENSIAAEWAIYGLRLLRGDVAGAAVWLQQMPSNTAEDQDFNATQWINLAMRQDTTGSFALDSVQHAWLEYMAEGGSPVRDYARSLLGLLTGQRFDPEIPEEEAELRYESSNWSAHADHVWKIYPVPASDALHFEWEKQPTDAVWQIVIVDMLGNQKLIEQVQARSGYQILSVELLPRGFYYAAVSNLAGEMLHRAPVVILR
jgi:hypothetical protein